jgi:Flp pilus assembly pilin Flp
MAQFSNRSAAVWARKSHRDEAGATAIEYALLIAGIGASIVGIVLILGIDVAAIYDGILQFFAGQGDCAQANENCGV